MTDPGPPIIPGHPQPQLPPGHPLGPPTQPLPVPGYYYPPQQPVPDPNAGIRKAGTVALWVWITFALIPVAVIGLCIVLCTIGAIGGAVTDTSTP